MKTFYIDLTNKYRIMLFISIHFLVIKNGVMMRVFQNNHNYQCNMIITMTTDNKMAVGYL